LEVHSLFPKLELGLELLYRIRQKKGKKEFVVSEEGEGGSESGSTVRRGSESGSTVRRGRG